MKNKLKNCMASTALSLILLSFIAALYQARFLCISSVFEILLANIVLHIGLTALDNFESKYFLVELLIKLCFTNVILIIFGFLFGWYSSTPIWVLVLMGIIVYLTGGLMDVFLLSNDVTYINKKLKQQREQNNEALNQ